MKEEVKQLEPQDDIHYNSVPKCCADYNFFYNEGPGMVKEKDQIVVDDEKPVDANN